MTQPITPMVERVARAMQEFAARPLGNLKSLDGVHVGGLGDAWPYLAKAAIAAMLEPTDEQLMASGDAYYDLRAEDSSAQPGYRIWIAMISAALGEKPE